jgi:hypothetical protein
MMRSVACDFCTQSTRSRSTESMKRLRYAAARYSGGRACTKPSVSLCRPCISAVAKPHVRLVLESSVSSSPLSRYSEISVAAAPTGRTSEKMGSSTPCGSWWSITASVGTPAAARRSVRCVVVPWLSTKTAALYPSSSNPSSYGTRRSSRRLTSARFSGWLILPSYITSTSTPKRRAISRYASPAEMASGSGKSWMATTCFSPRRLERRLASSAARAALSSSGVGGFSNVGTVSDIARVFRGVAFLCCR